MIFNDVIRTSIESSYSHEVDELRMQYTPEDKEILKEFLDAKEEFCQKAETLEKQILPKTELDEVSIIIGKLNPPGLGADPSRLNLHGGQPLTSMDFTFRMVDGRYPIASQPPTMHLYSIKVATHLLNQSLPTLTQWFFQANYLQLSTYTDMLPLQTFTKDLDDEQLALWLSNHPHLEGIECQDDIHKLRGMLQFILAASFHNN